MFDNFCSKFKCDRIINVQDEFSLKIPVNGFKDFFTQFNGMSFNNGLYNIHNYSDIDKWNDIIFEAFPEYKSRLICFGYDWLGRQFAIDLDRMEDGEPLILLLEPGTGETLEIPSNFIDFHEDILINSSDAALADIAFNEWVELGNPPPKRGDCIGYKQPLFLGGVDGSENFENVDMEVYWSISGQLINKIKGLPIGAKIGNVTID